MDGWVDRVSDKPDSVAAPDNAISDGKKTITFNFDQLERHRVFWEYLRAKDWTAVSSFLEKKVIAYRNEEVLRRKFRVMNLLADMFDSCHWVIVHSPYIYSPGITKSVALCDVRVVYMPTHASCYPPPPLLLLRLLLLLLTLLLLLCRT